MTKGRITKGILLTTLFSGLAVVFFFLTFMTTNLAQAGITELVFGRPAVAMGEFIKMETIGGAFQNAFSVTWWPGLKSWGKEYFAFFEHLFDAQWWVTGKTFVNSLTFYAFALVIAIWAIYILYTIIFGLFVYKKKKSSLFNVLWFTLAAFCISFLIVGFHGAIYGNEAYKVAGGGNANTGYIALLFTNILNISKDTTLEMTTKIKAWGLLISLVILLIILIPLLYQAIANIFVGIPVYLHQHKYDYLEKAERKRRQQFYKNHGYENIANQQTGKKDKKNKKDANNYESNNPYVQQQQAAMGYTGANPNPYMNAYGYGPYPYGAQVNAIPAGGNTVHTGNNAPLIVQYITNGRDENQLKSNQIDENTTSIYGTSRARQAAPQPAPQPTTTVDALTKDDIKSAVYDILKENNLINSDISIETPTEPQKEYSLEDDYDVLTLDDLKSLIKDSVQDLLPKQEETKPVEEVKEEPKPVEEVVTHLDEALTEETKIEPAPVAPVAPKAEEKIIPPIVVAIPTKIEEEPEIIEEPEVEETEEETMSEEELRTLIASQLQEALKTIKVEEKETVQEVPVYVKEIEKPQQIIKEVIKEVPTVKEIIKEVQVPVEVQKTVEVVKEVPVVQEVPVEPKRPLIPQPEIRGKEKEIKKVDAVKLNFQEKLLTSGTDIVLAYNSLKNLLMSYGLKDRISNSGDTFRLHKKTYCKITMGGAHLKIYLALDPKNYLNTAIPVGDASFKELYRDIPLVFRVKSDNSLERARDLIIDCMNTQNLTQISEEGNIDYASQLKNK